jgi:hypothetical protein
MDVSGSVNIIYRNILSLGVTKENIEKPLLNIVIRRKLCTGNSRTQN